MSELIDKRLVDEAVDAYVDWREERASVWDAYTRWTSAPVADCPLAFSAYRAALDREERAAHVYAELMTRVSVAVSAFQLDVAGELCTWRSISAALEAWLGSCDVDGRRVCTVWSPVSSSAWSQAPTGSAGGRGARRYCGQGEVVVRELLLSFGDDLRSVVIGACGGLIAETLFTDSLSVALAVGAVTCVATLIVQRRQHLRVRDAYAPEAVDRAAIFVPAGQTAETA